MAPPASHDHRVRFLDHAGGRLLDLSEKEKKGKRRKKEEKRGKKRKKKKKKERKEITPILKGVFINTISR
jgi:hypothetical protein